MVTLADPPMRASPRPSDDGRLVASRTPPQQPPRPPSPPPPPPQQQQQQPSSTATTFSALGIANNLVRALASLRITRPTPIQQRSIPLILKGHDLIGGSPTGSGKTLAFALPILERLAVDMVASFAVVLTPTRELAVQLHEQFLAVAEGSRSGARVQLVLGGLDMVEQATAIARDRPHILVATPGRLVDLMRSAAEAEWSLRRCKFLVLDEADRLLSPSFGPELAYLFSHLPDSSSRQTLLFTATLTKEIEALATQPDTSDGQTGKRRKRPILCRIEGDTSTPPTLRQRYVFVPSHVREPYLYYLLTHSPCFSAERARAKTEQGGGAAAAEDRIEAPDRRRLVDGDEDDGDGEGGGAFGRRRGATSASSSMLRRLEASDALRTPTPSTIVFASRCRTVALLSSLLEQLEVPNVALHSRLAQSVRSRHLEDFRAGRVAVLVTTDVGARGLDVPEVELVVNWELPREWRDYVHRVGRTARNGRWGDAVSFVGERDVELLQAIEAQIGVRLTELALPEDAVLARLNAVSTARRVATVQLADERFGERAERNRQKARLVASSEAARAARAARAAAAARTKTKSKTKTKTKAKGEA